MALALGEKKESQLVSGILHPTNWNSYLKEEKYCIHIHQTISMLISIHDVKVVNKREMSTVKESKEMKCLIRNAYLLEKNKDNKYFISPFCIFS